MPASGRQQGQSVRTRYAAARLPALQEPSLGQAGPSAAEPFGQGAGPQAHPLECSKSTGTRDPSWSVFTKPVRGVFHSLLVTTVGLTSRPRRRAARLHAWDNARRSGSPITRRSISTGAGPGSPVIRPAQEPKMNASAIPGTSARASARTTGGPRVFRTSPESSVWIVDVVSTKTRRAVERQDGGIVD